MTANGEDQDVAGRVLARDEELGGVAEQVQQRLGDGERPEDQQVQPASASPGGWAPPEAAPASVVRQAASLPNLSRRRR